ncbi:MAG: hypothetical protein AMXMBFR64_57230 [Myxococcales bacterium]
MAVMGDDAGDGRPNIEQELTAWVATSSPAPVAVWLFGSAAAGAMRSDSDVDVAVLTADPARRIPAVERWALAADLARRLGRDVDLVDLRAAPTVLQMQVVSTGRRVVCRDPAAAEAFESLVWAMYVRFVESRRDIVDDAVRRGTIHGR